LLDLARSGQKRTISKRPCRMWIMVADCKTND
jgi:hypothetical protein